MISQTDYHWATGPNLFELFLYLKTHSDNTRNQTQVLSFQKEIVERKCQQSKHGSQGELSRRWCKWWSCIRLLRIFTRIHCFIWCEANKTEQFFFQIEFSGKVHSVRWTTIITNRYGYIYSLLVSSFIVIGKQYKRVCPEYSVCFLNKKRIGFYWKKPTFSTTESEFKDSNIRNWNHGKLFCKTLFAE